MTLPTTGVNFTTQNIYPGQKRSRENAGIPHTTTCAKMQRIQDRSFNSKEFTCPHSKKNEMKVGNITPKTTPISMRVEDLCRKQQHSSSAQKNACVKAGTPPKGKAVRFPTVDTSCPRNPTQKCPSVKRKQIQT